MKQPYEKYLKSAKSKLYNYNEGVVENLVEKLNNVVRSLAKEIMKTNEGLKEKALSNIEEREISDAMLKILTGGKTEKELEREDVYGEDIDIDDIFE